MSYPEQRPFKPLVVGPPRAGFTLLNSVVIHFAHRFYQKWDVDLKLALLRVLIDRLGEAVSDDIVATFREAGITDDLIYNGNFREMVGGPKWLAPDDIQKACFRKYIGVRGMGDFLLITSHPRPVLDYYEVIHSHASPRIWATHPDYGSYTKYSSIRNPIGTVNSAVFSINAIASEYIQRFLPPEDDNDELRQNLALYKLTDLTFLTGIVDFYADYWREFLEYRDHFAIMRWEDLITNPVEAIVAVAKSGNVEISRGFAQSIWDRIGHRNLTGHHKHNFRKGGGIVGGWKNWLVNEHLDLMKRKDFDEISMALGYGPVEYLDVRTYNPYQKRLVDHLNRGKIWDEFSDRDLFGFAFQKSNLKWENLEGFRSSDWRAHTRIERSCFADEVLERRVWDIAEETVGALNGLFEHLLSMEFTSRRASHKNIQDLITAHRGVLSERHEQRFMNAFAEMRAVVQSHLGPQHIVAEAI